MEISRFAARARRGVNVQNEIRFDVYDNMKTPLLRRGNGTFIIRTASVRGFS